MSQYPQDFDASNQYPGGYPQQQGVPQQQNSPQFNPNAYNPNAYNSNAYNPNNAYNQPPQYVQNQNLGYVPPQVIEEVIIITGANQNQAGFKQRRLAEIDIRLDNDFSCYICWIYFVAIMATISTILDISYLSNSQFQGLEGLLAYSILANVYQILTYYTGITALRNRDYEKNQLFKNMLIFGFFLQVCSVIFVYSSGVNFGASELGAILGFCIIVIVYLTADRISKVLKERSDLLRS